MIQSGLVRNPPAGGEREQELQQAVPARLRRKGKCRLTATSSWVNLYTWVFFRRWLCSTAKSTIECLSWKTDVSLNGSRVTVDSIKCLQEIKLSTIEGRAIKKIAKLFFFRFRNIYMKLVYQRFHLAQSK